MSTEDEAVGPISANEPTGSGDDAGALKLRARIASSLVLAPAALAAAWIGGAAFSGFIAAAAVILAREWTRMSDADGGDQAFALAAAGAAGATIAAAAQQMPAAWLWMTLAALASAVERGRRGGGFGPAVSAALGVIYVTAPCVALVWLRLNADGAERVTYLFACVWAADTGAFAAGVLIGGRLLAPKISPKKTWAGLVAGALLAGVVGGLLASGFGWTGLAAKALGAAVLGVGALCGDLLESWLKRRYGVKDAGALIPGHGGLLDRVDGLMVAAVLHAGKVLIWP
ncbi:MAG: phosphatidate cytidylyltransferase [Maricaulaceae bacterium]|jgi:phosphatidate cytidylyltransferase